MTGTKPARSADPALARARSLLAAGDIAGAQESSRLAKMWSWIGFGIGALISVIYVLFVGIAAINGAR